MVRFLLASDHHDLERHIQLQISFHVPRMVRLKCGKGVHEGNKQRGIRRKGLLMKEQSG